MFGAKHLNSIHAGHYKNTAGCATEVMPVPDVVKISMSQNIGAPCKPLVKKGDSVLFFALSLHSHSELVIINYSVDFCFRIKQGSSETVKEGGHHVENNHN